VVQTGNIIFRAMAVEDRGGTIHVTAGVKDDTVARALEEMRGDRYNRGTNAQFTWAGRSKYVKVGEVHVTTTTARSKMFRLELEIQEAPQDAMMEVSIGGKSPADLTELSLRSVLFGETNPLADQYMGFASQIADPLAPLRENRVSEEIIRPLSELLITELLVGTGRTRSVIRYRLGVAIRERRNLSISREAPNRYSNERPAVRSIQGEVKI
jgi:hypothetical protein